MKIYFMFVAGFILLVAGQVVELATAAPLADTVGLNGAACAYPTIGNALADAAEGDTLYLAPAVYNESLGEIGLDLHLTAATADCTTADPEADRANYIINGTMFAAEGGVVHITAGHTVTFTRLTLQNGQATRGGVLYVAGGATAVLERSDVRLGIAAESGGLIYVAEGGNLVAYQAFLEGGSAETGGGLYLLGNAEMNFTNLWGSFANVGGRGRIGRGVFGVAEWKRGQ